MSQRSFSVNAFTATATADTTNLADGTYMALTAGGATNRCEVTEIYMGGHSAATNVNIMMFARHSQISGTKTALAAPNSDGPMDGLTQAVTTPALGFVAATVTVPQRAAGTTAARLNLSYNSFGGIVRWMQQKGSGWFITGVTASVSESSLSGFTGGGGGVMSAHIIYEQV